MRRRFLSSANFHSTIICSPKNWMNWDMQPAGWVICRTEKNNLFFCFLTERTHYQCVTCVLLLPDLHFRVHTAVDGGDTPGWARGDQSVSCWGEDSPLVLIEGLQWRILAWTLQLVPARQWQEEERKWKIVSAMSLFRFLYLSVLKCIYRNLLGIFKMCTPCWQLMQHNLRDLIAITKAS